MSVNRVEQGEGALECSPKGGVPDPMTLACAAGCTSRAPLRRPANAARPFALRADALGKLAPLQQFGRVLTLYLSFAGALHCTNFTYLGLVFRSFSVT
jgi:hypothetical protein